MKIEITIPVLNEESTIFEQITKIDHFIKNEFPDLDIAIVIADNGSTDKTQSISESIANTLSTVKYIRLAEKGVGRALKTSWLQSTADIVGYMDLDLATDMDHLKGALLPLMSDVIDVVTGSRLAKGSQVVGRKPIRKLTSISLNVLIKMIFSTKFTDGMCGFKFLLRKHVKKIIDCGATSDGWFFATEILIVAEKLNLSVMDLPVKWTDDPNSKVKILKLTKEYLQAMAELKKTLSNR